MCDEWLRSGYFGFVYRDDTRDYCAYFRGELMAKVSIQEQIEAVIAVISEDGDQKVDTDKLDAVVTTLMYLRDRRPEIELAAMIYRDEAVKAVLGAFPGAKVDAIRATVPRYDGDLITED